MNIEFPEYELKYNGQRDWAQIPETVALQYLADAYKAVVPVLTDLLNGIEVSVKCGLCRAKRNHGIGN